MGLITVRYPVIHPGIPRKLDGKKAAVLADLHNSGLSEAHGDLVAALKRENPDCILVAGDMITAMTRVRPRRFAYREAEYLLRLLAARWPIYYENGNHESRWALESGAAGRLYERYHERLAAAGIHFLENTSAYLAEEPDGSVRVTGLDLPQEYFQKLRVPRLTAAQIEALAGPRDPDSFQILLAHSPQFFPAYMNWGADLVLSGHFHGGIIRLPGLGGVISTSLHLFPRYDHGVYRCGAQQMIVSSGLGNHTIDIRINNPEELVILEFKCGG